MTVNGEMQMNSAGRSLRLPKLSNEVLSSWGGEAQVVVAALVVVVVTRDNKGTTLTKIQCNLAPP